MVPFSTQTKMINKLATVILWLFASLAVNSRLDASSPLLQVLPTAAGMSANRLARIDDVVSEGLRRGWMPGCVVLVGRGGRIVHWKAYGYRVC